MKIKIFTHQVKANILDDLPKVVEFFKAKNITVELCALEETPVSLAKTPPNLYLPNDNGQYDILMYVFDRKERYYSYALSFSKTLQVVEISTSVLDDSVDYTWKLMCHEIMHTFFHRLRIQGIFLDDPMDAMIVNGVLIPYYKNEDPYALDGNFAEAFKRLQPHWQKLFPSSDINYFKVQEFVPKDIYTDFGENSKWFIDPRIWKLANFVRGYFKKPVTINNWHVGGALNERGFRVPQSATGSPLSQHRFGRAIDISVSGVTPQVVHQTILANQKIFMDAGLTCIEEIAATPSWVHLDIRDTGLPGIIVVKP